MAQAKKKSKLLCSFEIEFYEGEVPKVTIFEFAKLTPRMIEESVMHTFRELTRKKAEATAESDQQKLDDAIERDEKREQERKEERENV